MSSGRSTSAAVQRRVAAAVLAVAAAPGALAAQNYPTMPVARPDADRLADVVRRLGAAPRDLSALIEAGELSFRLGDATAAAALYKRAEAIDSTNGRVKAGIAQILVNGERPGEALRYFDMAQRYGAPMARYAADRGLAYDLIGEQERAQRDYRLALAQAGANADDVDEARRRYALSLGISGRQAEALEQIDALLRKSDRGAWRARAFILAMSGDVAGANRIATSMMPAGMAGGLAAFFQRLPTLGATDRAFAVHFGEVAPTAARIADARMTPALPALGPDPGAPRRLAVAAVATPVTQQPAQRLSRSDQRRQEREAERARRDATRAPMPRATANAVPAAAPAATPRVPVQVATASTTPRVSVAPPPIATVTRAPAQVTTASTTLRVPSTPQPVATVTSAPVQTAATTAVARPPVTIVQPAVPAPVTSPQLAAATPTPAAAAPTPALASSPAAVGTSTMPSAVDAVRPVGAPVVASRVPTPSTADAAQIAAAAALPARPTSIRQGEDSILARIIAGISVPAAELDVPPMRRAVPVVAAPAAPGSAAALDEAARLAERNAAADEGRRQRLAARKAAAEKALADRRARETAEKKAEEVAAKKVAAEKLATQKKEAAEKLAAEKKAARAEPGRIWVQVAGGANAGDLPKAWKSVQDKTPALAGRRAYATPLRATNRVVTGPFKTEAEARALVNTLAKQGVAAFTFTSTAGQKMTRLDAK